MKVPSMNVFSGPKSVPKRICVFKPLYTPMMDIIRFTLRDQIMRLEAHENLIMG